MPKKENRSPLWRLPADTEVREEIEHHLEMRARQYEDEGLSPEDARAKARERFGDPERHAAECLRDAERRNRRWRVGQWLEDLRLDLRFALRQMGRRPGLAVLLVGMLALGIGAASTTAGLLHQALWQDLPFPEAERIVTLWEEQTVRGKTKNVVSPVNFLAWRDETKSFEAMSGFVTVSANLATADEPRRAMVRLVTDGYFDVFGLPPLRGSRFQPEDYDGEEGTRGVLISEPYWREVFGAREDLVGTSLEIDGDAYVVRGVMPAATAVDMGVALHPWGKAPDVYAPLPVSEQWRTARGRWLQVMGRLAVGATVANADAELKTVMARQRQRFPDFDAGWDAHALSLAGHLRDPVRLPLYAVAGAILVILLIVCVNASSLLLSRNVSRESELALRRALGAGRGRLGRQLLLEGLVVAGAAAVLGWIAARGLGDAARALLPDALRSSFLGSPTGGATPGIFLASVAGLAFFVLLLTWLPSLPSLGRLSRLVHAPDHGSRRQHRLRAAMVFVQVALTLVLLVGSVLMLETVRGLLSVDAGFERDGIVSFAIEPSDDLDNPQVFDFYRRLLEKLEALPGVSQAGAVTYLPMTGNGAATTYHATDRPRPEAGQEPVANIRTVRGDYFDALGIEVLEGRSLDERDGPSPAAEAGDDPAENEPGTVIGSIVVSRQIAERLWPGESAVGKDLWISWDRDGARRVVGVVEDVHHVGLGDPPRDTIYFSQMQEPRSELKVVLRGERGLESLAPEIRSVVAGLDPALPIFELRNLRGVVEDSLADQAFLLRLLVAFAVLALALSMLGVYGITALSVTESRREIGLRMALGARPVRVAALFVGRVVLWSLGAIVAGLGVAVLAGRSVESLLYGVSATEPGILLGVATLIFLTAVLSAVVPARRAAKVDPSRALRWE